MKVKNYTDQDALALEEINKCGYLGLDIDHGLFLTSDSKISRYRFKRLLALRKIEPVSNTLYEGAPPQQYVIA
ncbi:MAG: hypothetical protein ACRBBN_13350 [Methyloligellaceae bacterium]